MAARMKRTAAWTLAVFVFAAAIQPAVAGTSGTVSVTARVRAVASVTAVSDRAVLVQANTSWRLSCEGPEGVTQIVGEKTPGTLVTLPEETLTYSVAVE
ncbi:MAG: hypothetical protein ABFC80_08785 [Coriobacteriales bacterium]